MWVWACVREYERDTVRLIARFGANYLPDSEILDQTASRSFYSSVGKLGN